MWVELDRSGRVLDAKVTASSGQKLLDVEALRDLRNGHYSAFPTTAFGGENNHRFLVTLEYELAHP
jgi:TonB family protein